MIDCSTSISEAHYLVNCCCSLLRIVCAPQKCNSWAIKLNFYDIFWKLNHKNLLNSIIISSSISSTNNNNLWGNNVSLNFITQSVKFHLWEILLDFNLMKSLHSNNIERYNNLIFSLCTPCTASHRVLHRKKFPYMNEVYRCNSTIKFPEITSHLN